LQEADRAFRTGNLHAALAGWSSASVSGAERQRALLNRGVIRYRLGELTAAEADFRAAAATLGDPKLRQQALYNHGTALLVMEQRLNNNEKEQSRRRLIEALRRLQEAIALQPEDADAGHNREIAQARLATVNGKSSSALAARKPLEKNEQGATSVQQQGKATTGVGKAGAARDGDTQSGRRRTAPDLSPEQAVRMLDEARGREALRSGSVAGQRNETPTLPEKDW
jgi:tetratricopeptide (TPR) repeat protein